MADWKEAWRLAKFEIKASKWTFPPPFILIILVGMGIASSMGEYLNNGVVVQDLVFTLIFTFMPAWIRPKDFQMKAINETMVAGPSVMMLKMIPVQEDVLIKSRFFVYYVLAMPLQVIFLIMLYPITPALWDVLALGGYIAFSVIWLAFSIYFGSIFPASEAGDTTKKFFDVWYSVIFLICYLGILTAIHLITGQGILYWTIIAAQKWPLLSSVISILLAFVGVKYWAHYMKKHMRKMDYL
ncbi:hypothetical protein [Lentibacillus sp. CBA3610]|uniref:hypothetical protein n=1 Tax=Lentibacillus sp. CBA3610 TaxID=2518176 RepID=UPI00159614FA|nr:hypothetical protein [Lentibacillus sp. CBA3610]QKY70607.1 hypothetical protein Len3610_14315 [Lentibacillus sp. CBA3610]